MPTRELLTPAQRLGLDELPVDLDDRLMARHHTLSDEELAAALKRRTPAGRLGFAMQIALLKFPGRPLRSGERAPEKTLRYVASQVGEEPKAIVSYADGNADRGAGRETTRREHLSEIHGMLGLRPFNADVHEELRAWLAGVAAMTDSGLALVEALLEEMRRRRIVVPALYAVEGLAWESRREARSAVAESLVGGLSARQLVGLDGLLTTASDATRSDLVWLRQPPGAPSPDNFLKVVEKLKFVRSLGLPSEASRSVHHNRLSRLAAEGARMTPQNLSTLEAGRRRATLVAYLLDRAASLTDGALDMHDRMVGEALARAKATRDENFKGRGKAVNEKVGLYASVGKALIAAREAGGPNGCGRAWERPRIPHLQLREQATVDAQGAARGESRLVGGQPRDGPRHVLGRAEPPERVLLGPLASVGLRIVRELLAVPEHRRVYGAWDYAVDPHAFPGEVQRHLAGQREDSALRGGVGCHPLLGREGVGRAAVDDRAPAAF